MKSSYIAKYILYIHEKLLRPCINFFYSVDTSVVSSMKTVALHVAGTSLQNLFFAMGIYVDVGSMSQVLFSVKLNRMFRSANLKKSNKKQLYLLN